MYGVFQIDGLLVLRGGRARVVLVERVRSDAEEAAGGFFLLFLEARVLQGPYDLAGVRGRPAGLRGVLLHFRAGIGALGRVRAVSVLESHRESQSHGCLF